MRKKEEVKELIEPVIESEGFFLVDLKVSADDVIDVSVDSLEGVNVDACVDLSRKIEGVLDREKGDYELTVGGAGIGTVFKVPGQYIKNIGNEVDVKPVEGVPFKAVLKNFEDGVLTLAVEEKVAVPGKKKKEIREKEITMRMEEIRQIKDIIKF